MNGKDRQDLEVIIYRLDEQDKKREELENLINRRIDELQKTMDNAHSKTNESLRFLKESLFNPKEGLWAESQQNSKFRLNSTKAFWILVPAFLVATAKVFWDFITGN
tara:strand:+ start:508 stop:828 length:321 start_codon:yes stop_codon:yes gene_type:complete